MRAKTYFVIQGFILFFPTTPTMAQNYNTNFSYRPMSCTTTQATKHDLKTVGIWLGLKSGFSFNKVEENSRFKNSKFSSKTQSSSNNFPFHLELTRPFKNKLSGTISAVFIPEHNVRLISEEHGHDTHATYYLNTRVSSYGIMGRLNYELYNYGNLSQYVMAGAGAMLNTINNSELLIDYHGYQYRPNRSAVLLNNSTINLAWQVGTGVKYSVNEKLSLELGYLYLDRGKAPTKHAIDRNWVTQGISEPMLIRSGSKKARISPKLASHQVLFGVEFKL
jgi:opacity protein-like surface antigen